MTTTTTSQLLLSNSKENGRTRHKAGKLLTILTGFVTPIYKEIQRSNPRYTDAYASTLRTYEVAIPLEATLHLEEMDENKILMVEFPEIYYSDTKCEMLSKAIVRAMKRGCQLILTSPQAKLVSFIEADVHNVGILAEHIRWYERSTPRGEILRVKPGYDYGGRNDWRTRGVIGESNTGAPLGTPCSAHLITALSSCRTVLLS